MPSKETIRKTVAAKRAALTPEELESKSQAILTRVINSAWYRNAPELLTYLSKVGEVDTFGIVAHAESQGKTVYAPVTEAHGVLKWAELRDPHALRVGAFGIPEPAAPEAVTPPIDAPALVPCVAFSPAGHRVGYGGGYFDRFLARHRGRKIGLAFELQLAAHISVEDHDIPLDEVITEAGTYVF